MLSLIPADVIGWWSGLTYLVYLALCVNVTLSCDVWLVLTLVVL